MLTVGADDLAWRNVEKKAGSLITTERKGKNTNPEGRSRCVWTCSVSCLRSRMRRWKNEKKKRETDGQRQREFNVVWLNRMLRSSPLKLCTALNRIANIWTGLLTEDIQ